jgi:Domain of unknown function (DUF4145)
MADRDSRALFIRHAGSAAKNVGPRVSIQCPKCGRRATFDKYPGGPEDLSLGGGVVLGSRRCPADDCNTHVFFITFDGNVVACYPPVTIDFDPAGVPVPVREALEEAIVAHAHGCYRAAALMVRRAIEEICLDKKATGDNLYARIDALGGQVVLPQPFLEGLHDVRLLGNDAAHVEARVYEEVGDEEVVAGIAIAKELIRAVYQYEAIMGQLKKLRGAQAT